MAVTPEFQESRVFFEKLEEKLLNPETDLSNLSAEDQYALIKDKLAVDITGSPIIPTEGSEDDLLARLKNSKLTGEPLLVRFGIDPTGKDMHIGHAVPMLMLRRLQWMGHKVFLVIGDFTAQIGDASGRASTRTAISRETIEENASTYLRQAARIINVNNPDLFEYAFNSTWLNSEKWSMETWLQLFLKLSSTYLTERADFRQRKERGEFVSIAEAMYPLFEAADSVHLGADLHIGGTDQQFNLKMCRKLQHAAAERPEVYAMMNLLPGINGEIVEGRPVKMSKSLGNYIAVETEPNDMFGKVMSIPDTLMHIWYRELTEISSAQLSKLTAYISEGKIHPMEAKRALARIIVATFNGYDKGIVKRAEEHFDLATRKGGALITKDIPSMDHAPGTIKAVLVDSVPDMTQSDLSRLANQNGLKYYDEETDEFKPVNLNAFLKKVLEEGSHTFRVGKRRFVRINIEAT